MLICGDCDKKHEPYRAYLSQKSQKIYKSRSSYSTRLVCKNPDRWWIWTSILKSLHSLTDVPPSFCDMGNAISSLIAQADVESRGEGDECVLLSEEHSLVLTCCWVTLKVKQLQDNYKLYR